MCGCGRAAPVRRGCQGRHPPARRQLELGRQDDRATSRPPRSLHGYQTPPARRRAAPTRATARHPSRRSPRPPPARPADRGPLNHYRWADDFLRLNHLPPAKENEPSNSPGSAFVFYPVTYGSGTTSVAGGRHVRLFRCTPARRCAPVARCQSALHGGHDRHPPW